jgi:biotin carboxyl carrier protein
MKLLALLNARERAVDIEGQRITIDGQPLAADVVEVEPGVYSALAGGRSYEIQVKDGVDGGADVYVNGVHYAVKVRDPRRARRRGGHQRAGRQNVAAPMPGRVVRLLAAAGDQVQAGQGIAVVEAMKMQNEIKSPKSGTVVEVKAAPGETVGAGQTLAVVE